MKNALLNLRSFSAGGLSLRPPKLQRRWALLQLGFLKSLILLAMLAPSVVNGQFCTTGPVDYTVVNETDCDLYVTISYSDPSPCTSFSTSFVVDANDEYVNTEYVSSNHSVDAVYVQLWDGSIAYGTYLGAQYQCSSPENDDFEDCSNNQPDFCVHFNSDCTAARVEPSKCP